MRPPAGQLGGELRRQLGVQVGREVAQGVAQGQAPSRPRVSSSGRAGARLTAGSSAGGGGNAAGMPRRTSALKSWSFCGALTARPPGLKRGEQGRNIAHGAEDSQPCARGRVTTVHRRFGFLWGRSVLTCGHIPGSTRSRMFRRALIRRPGPDLAAGLTTADLGAPDWHTGAGPARRLRRGPARPGPGRGGPAGLARAPGCLLHRGHGRDRARTGGHHPSGRTFAPRRDRLGGRGAGGRPPRGR